MTSKRVLIVDDDEDIRQLLSDYLSRHGFQCMTAADGEAFELVFQDFTPDLVILDVMMPGDDGFTLCRRLRQHSQIPVVMLTASADDTDRILGLELGADDYIAKPFNPRELLARIKAILRRTQSYGGQARYLRFGPWQLDRTTRELVSQSGERQDVSGADFALLSVFLSHPQKVLSRDELFDLTRGRDAPPLDRSIDVHICRLRQRLGEDAKTPQLIKTVRGAGYILAVPVEMVG
ncbi:response regulator [Balneatrix alpica]|uniref:Response regulator n=1 Tax=Balneatrix alpica TaxID=75684 RepID=A0ABV5ZG57_9GAMM|nr:response regulator transcription factor [Balneatrix alpica]